MGQNEKYSFISVNADDADEIVIQTGAVQTSDTAPDVQPAKYADKRINTSEWADQDEPDKAPVGSAETQDLDEIRVAEEAPARPTSQYHETTREDLETVGPMSKMRIGILVCMIVLIAGFAAYYIFLR